MADIYPSYLAAKAGPYDYFPRTNATQPVAPQPQPQPFNLQMQPPPPVPALPPLSINIANARTPAAAPARPVGVPMAGDQLPKGVPSNAIPVIRGMDLSYDIPGTGQRLYPTLGGGVSEYSPDQRLELARYTEPANINAQAGIREASIRAGAELGAARLAQEGAMRRTVAELGSTPRPFGAEPFVEPLTKQVVPLPTYGVPTIDAATGQVSGFKPIGAAAQRAASAPQEGATGTYNGQKVVYKNGKWVSAGQ